MAHGSHRRSAKADMGQSKGPSQRQLRVGELVRHAVSEILTQGNFHDPILGSQAITVPEVRMSPDLRNATVFVMPLGGGDAKTVIDALTRNSKYLRGQLAQKMSQKFTPALTFTEDKSFDTYGRIDELLRSPRVARDLDSRGDGDSLEADTSGDQEET